MKETGYRTQYSDVTGKSTRNTALEAKVLQLLEAHRENRKKTSARKALNGSKTGAARRPAAIIRLKVVFEAR